jgi:hypothetical protein
MEIGSFIEMQFPRGNEYYNGNNVARLNSGRAAIFHSARVLGCQTVYLPYCQCDTVRDFLIKKQLKVQYYSIDEEFTPLIEVVEESACIVIVNYFGIMSQQRLECLSNKFKNVIIDNSQAFFCKPLVRCMNVYSVRKFIGVPDGAYAIGDNANRYVEEYEQDFSSDTSQFLLQRIEYGCEGKAYESRMLNEHRIDASGIKKMSKLTHTILDGTNYDLIINKRIENFEIAKELFDGINCLDASKYYDNSCVPMVYPLVVEDVGLLGRLQEAKHFQGHWWSYLLDEMPGNSFEYWISRYVIPITIDQRYGKEELHYLLHCIKK